jgi:hypothetical protein
MIYAKNCHSIPASATGGHVGKQIGEEKHFEEKPAYAATATNGENRLS